MRSFLVGTSNDDLCCEGCRQIMVSYEAEHKKIDLRLFIQPLGLEKAQLSVFLFSLTYTPDK